MDAIFPDDIFKCIFLNANIWILIKFSLKFVCKGPIDNIYQRWFRYWLGAGQRQAIILLYIVFGSVCNLRNRTVTSLDMWIHVLHWRRSNWCLKSPVTQLDCLFKRLFRQTSTPASLALCEGNPLVTDGFPSQNTTIGITLCQRWPNVSVPTLGRCWHNVGPTLAHHRWANWQIHVGPTLVSRRWPNVRVDVGPTLGNVGPTSQC